MLNLHFKHFPPPPHTVQVRGLRYDEAVIQCQLKPHKAAIYLLQVGFVPEFGNACPCCSCAFLSFGPWAQACNPSIFLPDVLLRAFAQLEFGMVGELRGIMCARTRLHTDTRIPAQVLEHARLDAKDKGLDKELVVGGCWRRPPLPCSACCALQGCTSAADSCGAAVHPPAALHHHSLRWRCPTQMPSSRAGSPAPGPTPPDECYATKGQHVKKIGYKAKGRGTFLVSKRCHVKVRSPWLGAAWGGEAARVARQWSKQEQFLRGAAALTTGGRSLQPTATTCNHLRPPATTCKYGER